MVRLTDPQPGNSVYDPCVGTGGLLIAAEDHVASETGRHHAITIFGQDFLQQACVTAQINLILHGNVNVSIQRGDAITNPSYLSSTGELKQFDRVLTDPPFSLKYQQNMPLIPQHTRYGQSRVADLMFVQHVLASLTPDGVGVIAVPNGVLFRGGDEGRIRREMVRDGRIAAVIALGRNLFHVTSIPACLLVVRGATAAHATVPDVLFINAEQEVDVTRSKNHLAPRHVEKIVTTYHGHREIRHFSRLVSVEEIASKEFDLNVSKYIDADLVARAKRLISHNRNQLVELYLTWGDQYATSLALLEHRRELTTTRLATKLEKLGYQWPLT